MKLNVFGLKVTVSAQPNLMSEHGCRGIYQPSTGKMIYDPTLKHKDLLQTVIHEVIHAVICRVGIEQARMSEDMEEIICESVSVALVENWKQLNQLLRP